MYINLGLCCIVNELREGKPPIFSSRTCRLATYYLEGEEKLKELGIQNLKDTYIMFGWCKKNNIKTIRLSSDIFPHVSNPKIERYSLDFADELLKKIGNYAKKNEMRVTFHPGQYNIIGSPKEHVFQNTLLDLDKHAEILDRMGMGNDSVMVIHGGGTYGDKKKSIDKFVENFHRLPERVKRRLVIENCEKCFSIKDALDISKRVNIPTAFDSHHYDCYKLLHKDEEFKPAGDYVEEILNTWSKRGIKPKFHISEQGSGKIGHHSDYIENIPEYMIDIKEKYGVDIDIMIEAKQKERAIFKLYEKYNTIFNFEKNDGIKM